MLARGLWFVGALLLAGPCSAAAAAVGVSPEPGLFVIRGDGASIAAGAQQAYPIAISEKHAFEAIFKGGLWIPDGTGARIHARYLRHIEHPGGDWTWVGRVQTRYGPQSMVITFGKDAVFGLIPRPRGYPLRIQTAHGKTLLVQTSGEVLHRTPRLQLLQTGSDFAAPPRRAAPLQAGSSATAQVVSASGGIPVVDVMVAYTPGFVAEYGSQSAALTRINYVVDVANQAYVDSQVRAQIRLVHTVEVDYPDNTYDPDAVSDLTGVDIQTGQPVAIPASLSRIHSLRQQYGADLVSMIRKYDDATNGYCGFAWIIGADGQPIDPSQDNAYGYSVVGDGSDNGYYCYDKGLAHELGHNMGSVHDHAHPSLDNHGNPITGEYPYSYGYATPPGSGFFTVMAYGEAGQAPVNVFSNPGISICQNQPCGVANQEDNARSLNQTIPLIAQFEPTGAGSSPTHNDVNGDETTDLLFYSASAHQLVYWTMAGPQFVGWQGFSVNSAYVPSGTGDLNGDGRVDLLWSDGSTLYVWLNDGNGGFVAHTIMPYASGGWFVLGTGDVNGDGKDDILWYNPSQHKFVYWLMAGSTYTGYQDFSVPSNFTPAGEGDLNGDHRVDLLWTDNANNLYAWLGNGTGFTQQKILNYATGGWSVAGVEDIDEDGKADIVWFNPSQHKLVYWLMNGASYRSYRDFVVDPTFQFAGVGDYDGNGAGDILWSTSTNNLNMWLGNGSTFTQQPVSVSSYASGYTLLP